MMLHISEIEETERGRVFLFAGGTSVNDFDFDKIRGDDKIAAINYFPIDMQCNYLIYHDAEVAEFHIDNPLIGCTYIAYKPNAAIADYYYTHTDYINGCHTSPVALQILDALGFGEIVLVGFDYYGNPAAPHYYDDAGRWIKHASPERLTRLLRHKERRPQHLDLAVERMYKQRMFGNDQDAAIRDFDALDLGAAVTNANPASRLEVYPTA